MHSGTFKADYSDRSVELTTPLRQMSGLKKVWGQGRTQAGAAVLRPVPKFKF
jgi:hypothetical protein